MKSVRVTAAVIRRGEKILLARRSASMSRPLLWEFPGGKVEAGESDAECLRRELREELGVECRIDEPVGVYPHAYSDIRIELAVYRATLMSGEPRPVEHAAVVWIFPAELPRYELAEADIPAACDIGRG